MKFLQGCRYLIRENRPLGWRVEVEVWEISPSGKYAKFKFISGSVVWEEICDWVIIEQLGN